MRCVFVYKDIETLLEPKVVRPRTLVPKCLKETAHDENVVLDERLYVIKEPIDFGHRFLFILDVFATRGILRASRAAPGGP